MENFDSGVPRPLNRLERHRFDLMQIGDSFEIPMSEVTCVASSAQWAGKKYGMKFSVRKDKVNGVARCWRVA